MGLFDWFRDRAIRKSIAEFRRDLTRLDIADFLVKHAGTTMDSRDWMVAQMVAVLRESASPQEQDTITKVLVAVIGIEAIDGWAYTVGVLGTILHSEIKEPDIRKLIGDALSLAERGLMATQVEGRHHFLEMIRLARAGDFEGILAYETRNRA